MVHLRFDFFHPRLSYNRLSKKGSAFKLANYLWLIAGFGLIVAKQIICDHSGNITAQSHPDQGTAFSITLPIVEGQFHN